MRWLAFFACLLLSQAANAQVVPGFPPGAMLGRGALDAAAAAPSYTGPGDIVAFAHWYGLRAYSAAYATAGYPAFDWWTNSGATTGTVHCAANGGMSVSDMVTLNAAQTLYGTIYISKWYDQAGYGSTDAGVDLVNGNTSQLPIFNNPATPSAASPFALHGDGARLLFNNSLGTVAQPFALVAIAFDANNLTAVVGAGTSGNSYIFMTFTHTASTIGITGSNGGVATDNFATATASNTALNAIQGIYNDNQLDGGIGSYVSVNGTSGSAITNVGADALTSIGIMYNTNANLFTGYLCEFGVLAATPASSSLLGTNMQNAIANNYTD